VRTSPRLADEPEGAGDLAAARLLQTRQDEIVGDGVAFEHAASVDRDWSQRAGTLTWDCRETADHIVDVVFSYTLQLAAEAQERYLSFGELHALPEARPLDLVDAIAGVGRMFVAMLATASPGARAWHPFGCSR
jgi:hypothetical protein